MMVRLAGWGRVPTASCRVLSPGSMIQATADCLRERSVIARGNGRSYGDASLNPDATLSTLRLDRLLDFDPDTGLLTAEAGLLLSDLLAVFVPRGWFPPVTPGTRFVTLGGMLASDVHGKNHHVAGSFSEHVAWFDLLCGDGAVRRCSRTQNADLFHATCGGMGLTGLVQRLQVRLRRIETPWIVQETLRCRDLDETLAAFRDSERWTYSVAWIDCLARGGHRGRALLYRGEHAGPDATVGGAPSRRTHPGARPRCASPWIFPAGR